MALSAEEVHRRAAKETCHKHIDRFLVQFVEASDLFNLSVLHDGNAMTHRHGFTLVVGDEYRGQAEVVHKSFYLTTGLQT